MNIEPQNDVVIMCVLLNYVFPNMTSCSNIRLIDCSYQVMDLACIVMASNNDNEKQLCLRDGVLCEVPYIFTVRNCLDLIVCCCTFFIIAMFYIS